jgi:hypothetical protein
VQFSLPTVSTWEVTFIIKRIQKAQLPPASELLKRRLSTSLLFALTTSFIKLYPPAERVLVTIANGLGSLFHLPLALTVTILILTNTAFWYLILYKTKFGPLVDDWVDRKIRQTRLKIGPFRTCTMLRSATPLNLETISLKR